MLNNLTTTQIVLIIVGALVAVYAIIRFTEKSTEEFVPPETNTQSKPNAKYILYSFRSPHCPYSRNFDGNHWGRLRNHFGPMRNIELRDVDVTQKENENLAFYYNAEYTPCVVLAGPNKIEMYKGKFEFDDIAQFVNDKMNN